jgi:hypothetical protein
MPSEKPPIFDDWFCFTAEIHAQVKAVFRIAEAILADFPKVPCGTTVARVTGRTF